MASLQWVQTSFSDCWVASCVQIVNDTAKYELVHMKTSFLSGQADLLHSAPGQIGPKEKGLFVAKSASSRIRAATSGSHGVSVWQIKPLGSPIAAGTQCTFLCILWSAPRFLSVNSNTLAIGLLPGPPHTDPDQMFQIMYTKASHRSFFTRFSCSYDLSFNTNFFADSRFIVFGQISGQLKSLASIRISEVNTSNEVERPALLRRKALAKCLVHDHQRPNDDERPEILYDYHLALMIEYLEPPDSDRSNVWVVEMHRPVGQNLREWRNENFVSCRKIPKEQVRREREHLQLKTFLLGSFWLDVEDLSYCCQHLRPVAEDKQMMVCQEWIRSVAGRLNLPNQEVLDLLIHGDNGWFGLDWLRSIQNTQITDSRDFNGSEQQDSGISMRIGGRDKLRTFLSEL